MTRIALLLMSLCLSLPALAEQKQSYGDLDVHYSAFNSGFLQPEVAAATGLVRSKTQGVVNVACVGGSWVAPDAMVQAGDWAGIERLAAEAVAALKS